MLIKQFQYA